MIGFLDSLASLCMDWIMVIVLLVPFFMYYFRRLLTGCDSYCGGLGIAFEIVLNVFVEVKCC